MVPIFVSDDSEISIKALLYRPIKDPLLIHNQVHFLRFILGTKRNTPEAAVTVETVIHFIYSLTVTNIFNYWCRFHSPIGTWGYQKCALKLQFNPPHGWISFSKSSHSLASQHNIYSPLDIRPRQNLNKESWMLTPKSTLSHLQHQIVKWLVKNKMPFQTGKHLTMSLSQYHSTALSRAKFEQVWINADNSTKCHILREIEDAVHVLFNCQIYVPPRAQ